MTAVSKSGLDPVSLTAAPVNIIASTLLRNLPCMHDDADPRSDTILVYNSACTSQEQLSTSTTQTQATRTRQTGCVCVCVVYHIYIYMSMILKRQTLGVNKSSIELYQYYT